MGRTPIPLIRPPAPSPDELFRREITPNADRMTPLIANIALLLIFAVIVVALLWWAA